MGLTTWLLRLAYGAGGVVGVAVALLYVFQERLLYVPKIPGVPDDYSVPPERYGFEAEDVIIEAADGIKLHAWMLKAKHWTQDYTRTRPVILFFQENAGNMSFRLPFLRVMMRQLNCPIFAVSYRGYGLSQGRPNEKGIRLDAEAALQYLRRRPDVDTSRVVVFGRSLGGAVGIYLVSHHEDQVCALIIENTFTGVEDMVSQVVPPLGHVIGRGKPLNFLVTNKWASRRVIDKIRRVPLMMVVSELDEMVPKQQMYELHRLQRAPVCKLLSIPGAHHMDAYDVAPELYWSTLKDFMAQHVEALPAANGTCNNARQ